MGQRGYFQNFHQPPRMGPQGRQAGKRFSGRTAPQFGVTVTLLVSTWSKSPSGAPAEPSPGCLLHRPGL